MIYLIEQTTDRIKASYTDRFDGPINGFDVMYVPNDVSVDEDVSGFDRAALRDQKFEGILEDNASFEYVYGEANDNPSSLPWDLAASGTRAATGGVTWLPPLVSGDPGFVQTSTIDISSDGAFDTFLPYWEIYTLERTEVDGLTKVQYVRVNPDHSSIKVSISNDNGSTFAEVDYLEEEILPAMSSDLVLKFENTDPANRYYLGSFAFLY
jgi:hypothetical protein